MKGRNIISLLISVLSAGLSFSQSPPANDLCSGAIDISNGAWYAGNNVGAKYNCEDHRTGNCGATQQGVNMCCGIEGIESSVWFWFTAPANQVINVDFRNIACNPVSFFGVTTSLQGFVLDRVDGAGAECMNPQLDITKSCFNLNNTNDAYAAMSFNANAGVKYFIELDTKKNSFSSCGSDCANASNTCHSTCNWELRISSPGGLPLWETEMFVTEKNNGILIDWTNNGNNNHLKYKLERRLYGKEAVLLAENETFFFEITGNHFQFTDHNIPGNGTYIYELSGYGPEEEYILLNQQEILVRSKDNFSIVIYPNPASAIFNLSFTGAEKEIVSYSVYDSRGVKILNGMCTANSSSQVVNVSQWPSGVYSLIASLNGRIYTGKLFVYPPVCTY